MTNRSTDLHSAVPGLAQHLQHRLGVNRQPNEPEEPRPEPPPESGAMTGATGSLTPESSDEAFVPAELREMADPGHHRDVAASQPREPAGEVRPAIGNDDGDERSDQPERF